MGRVTNGGQRRHDDQKNYNNSNYRNPDHVRSDTVKHQYKKYDELTNDENFAAGKPSRSDKEMDFRDKHDNLRS